MCSFSFSWFPFFAPVLVYNRSSNAFPPTLSTTCDSWRNTPAKNASATQIRSRPKRNWRPFGGCSSTSRWGSCVRRTCSLHWALKKAWLRWGCGHNRSRARLRPLRGSLGAAAPRAPPCKICNVESEVLKRRSWCRKAAFVRDGRVCGTFCATAQSERQGWRWC